ncbi:MAG TPA: radical SAM protein [Thermodesulfobacteriaceae bacterium]|nr:radical SAM protein [Thermodesulfobacteriaceae bacterium]
MKHPYEMPSLVYADSEGRIFDLPSLKMAGRSGYSLHPVDLRDLIPLPEGSELFVLPNRMPVGWDSEVDEMVVLDEDPALPGVSVQAVAAFMAPAHTQTALAAFHRARDGLESLPLFAYTAVGWWKGRFWAAGFRSDPDPRQDFRNISVRKIRSKTLALMKTMKANRLIKHLGKCSLTYGCPAAKNLFLGRWEAPLPTSPVCNARCMGCLSEQPEGGPPATQERIAFVPAPAEIAETAVYHLQRSKRPIVSFGQGCEGEPLLQGYVLEDSIRKIREETAKGTINLNTNASLPVTVERLVDAGLDSMRISMNSSRAIYYHAYYRCRGYGQEDVLSSWRIMKEAGRFVSLNLFVLPGLTDETDEIDRLSDLIEDTGLDLIQLRNHNIDPDWYLEGIGYRPAMHRTGIQAMVKILKKRFPGLKTGYFNPVLR